MTFPSVPLPDGTPLYDLATIPAKFDGTILRPANVTAYPGPRPVVVLQHGHNAGQCALWYIARALAGNGYVALVYTQPYNTIPKTLGVDLDAVISALDYVGSPQNPYAAYTDSSTIGLVGYSEGAIAVSYAQGLPQAHDVRAIAAIDNLTRWLDGDPGGVTDRCPPSQRYPDNPRVPALGLAMDTACWRGRFMSSPPDIKLTGWNWWSRHRVPAMTLVMRGYRHSDFNDGFRGGSEKKLHQVAYFVEAWLDLWLKNNRHAEKALLGCSANGKKIAQMLSGSLRSAAYLPDAGVHTADYRSYLSRKCP